MMPTGDARVSSVYATVTFDDVVRILRILGIKSGDTVITHNSLSSMGYVEGGADTVIDAFLQVLGPDGTLCMPTIVYAAQGVRPPFDPKSTPSEVGIITETLRLRLKAHRSNNPTHSIAAIGLRSEEITAGHARGAGRPSVWGELAFGHESPWQKLYDLNATCVLLGVDWNVNTMFHYIQARFIEPYWNEFAAPVPFPYFDLMRMGRELESRGIVRSRWLGAAFVKFVECRPMVDVTLAAFASDPTRFFRDGEQNGFVRWFHRLPRRRRRLRAGGAKLDITPPPELTGDRHVLEPLYVRAVVFGWDEVQAAFVLCDLKGMRRGEVIAARNLIEAETGIEACRIMISCTHNHADLESSSFRAAGLGQYTDTIVHTISEAVQAARDRLEEVRIGIGRKSLVGIARNRRFRNQDGNVVTLRRAVPSSWKADRLRSSEVGPVDGELNVLRLENLQGEVIALLTSLGCHNDTRGFYEPVGLSGDFFGHAMLTLERLYPSCVAGIAYGAGGDVDFDFLDHLNLDRARKTYPFQQFGRLLAAQVAEAAETADVQDVGYLDVRSVSVRFRLSEDVQAREVDSQELSTEVQVIQIGDLCLVGVPAEVFAETSIDIKSRARTPHVVFVGEANGGLGYVPPPSAFARGGYEVDRPARARLMEESEPRLRETVLGLLEESEARRTKRPESTENEGTIYGTGR